MNWRERAEANRIRWEAAARRERLFRIVFWSYFAVLSVGGTLAATLIVASVRPGLPAALTCMFFTSAVLFLGRCARRYTNILERTLP